MKRLILEQSSEEFDTSHSGLALVGACINGYSDLGRYVGRVARAATISPRSIFFAVILACSCLGKSEYQVITAKRERTIDKHGQFLLVQEISLEGRVTYLDLERLPSGKFATNALLMGLGAFAYNILRLIGQSACWPSMRRSGIRPNADGSKP